MIIVLVYSLFTINFASWGGVAFFIFFYFLFFITFGCEHVVFDFEFFLGGFVSLFEFAGIAIVIVFGVAIFFFFFLLLDVSMSRLILNFFRWVRVSF